MGRVDNPRTAFAGNFALGNSGKTAAPQILTPFPFFRFEGRLFRVSVSKNTVSSTRVVPKFVTY